MGLGCLKVKAMNWRRLLFPKIEYILLMAIFWGIAASGPRILNFDGDLPRHLLTGNLILNTQHVSTTDIFSYRTIGQPSFPHEWLAQVIFAIFDRLLGLGGVVLLTALLVMSTWFFVYKESYQKSQSLFVSLVILVLAVAASQLHVLPRPHVFTYLLLALWISTLETFRAADQRGWLLPVIMLLWVNLHGMFVIGIAVLGIYILGDALAQPSWTWFQKPKTKNLLIWGLLSFFTTFLSPSGIEIWHAIFDLGSNAYITSKIPEYLSPNFHLPETWPFILLLLGTLLGLARKSGSTSWTETLLVAFFTGLALYTSRMIPLFAIVIAPIATRVITSGIRQDLPVKKIWQLESNLDTVNSSAGGWIWLASIVLIVAFLFRSGTNIDPSNRGNKFDSRFFPVEAVEWLESHPQEGHMFNEFDWGGYLLLKLWPSYPIFMDGHTHIYGEALTREYEQVISLSPHWEEIIQQYEVRWAFVRAQSPLVNALLKTGQWEIAYQDDTAVILDRK